MTIDVVRELRVQSTKKSEFQIRRAESSRRATMELCARYTEGCSSLTSRASGALLTNSTSNEGIQREVAKSTRALLIAARDDITAVINELNGMLEEQ